MNCTAVEQEMLRGNESREGEGTRDGEGGAGKLRMRARRPRVYLRASDGDFANAKKYGEGIRVLLEIEFFSFF